MIICSVIFFSISSIFCVISQFFLAKLLALGILSSAAVRALVASKFVILSVSPLT